jgi:thioredoxin-related protein
MKKLLLFFMLSFASNFLFAQTVTPNVAAYLRIPTVPPFKLTIAPDSILFSKDELKKRMPTIIMIFSPDCDHCVHSTEDLIAHYPLFKKTQIVMASALPYEHVKKFYTTLKISDYPNIKVGEDKGYFLGTFFEVRSFPAIFLYDKKGNFKQVFDSNAKWETIAAAL